MGSELERQPREVLDRRQPVWHAYWTGSAWSPDAPLGRPAVGIRSAEVGFEDNLLNNAELYVVGADNAVWCNTATPAIGSGWGIGSPAGVTL